VIAINRADFPISTLFTVNLAPFLLELQKIRRNTVFLPDLRVLLRYIQPGTKQGSSKQVRFICLCIFCSCTVLNERYIEACIKSLLNQDFDYNQYELIFIDNGSTDRSKDIVTSYSDILYLKEPKQTLSS